MLKNIIQKTSGLLVKSKKAVLGAVSACALLITLGLTDRAHAVYTAPAVTVESMFDFAAIGETMLTLVATAFAVVAGIVLTIGVGKRFLRWVLGSAG